MGKVILDWLCSQGLRSIGESDTWNLDALIARREFFDAYDLVGGDILEDLSRAARRPVDLQGLYRIRPSQADGLFQRVAAKAAARRDMSIDGARRSVVERGFDALPMALRLLFLPTSLIVSE